VLVKCQECELQISDKAVFCPHCGCPFQQVPNIKKPRKSNKRRRLPNGFGQISEIKNRNLRKPFRAMVTVGKSSTGKPICKPLKPESYFMTYNDAYSALIEYNKNPYDLKPSITVKELYEKWSQEYFKTLKNDSSIRATKSAWLYCSSLHDTNVMDLRGRHIKQCMEEAFIVVRGEERKASAITQKKIKSIFNMMLDYAIEYEIIDRNYSRNFRLNEGVSKEAATTKKDHMEYTDDEVKMLWDNLEFPFVDAILIQAYSGWRPQELGLLELKNIDLDNWTFKGGMKTEAGSNRTVPIHTKIRGLVSKKYNESKTAGSETLLGWTDQSFTYDKLRYKYKQVVIKLGLDLKHRPHDGRVHFITNAKKYGVDEYAIKYFVGHAITDITEKVYTKRSPEWFRDEMEKIK
jgi:integrase